MEQYVTIKHFIVLLNNLEQFCGKHFVKQTVALAKRYVCIVQQKNRMENPGINFLDSEVLYVPWLPGAVI